MLRGWLIFISGQDVPKDRVMDGLIYIETDLIKIQKSHRGAVERSMWECGGVVGGLRLVHTLDS